MKSIYFRNFAVTALLVMICFLLLSASFLAIGRNFLLRDYEKNMIASAEEVAHVASSMEQTGSLSGWELGMSLSSISHCTDCHIFVTDPGGTIISCSDRGPVCEHLGKRISPELCRQLSTDGKLTSGRLEGLYQSDNYIVCRAIEAESSGKNLGYVFVTKMVKGMLGAWSAFLFLSTIITLAVLCMSLAASLILSKRMARPLDEIAAASGKFARGDFSVRVKQERDPSDEMGALIDSFNKMADSLETAEERRSEFIANISHELRTPMTTIAGFADGILDGTIPREEEEKYLTSIRDETRRLSRLVRDMLDASQMRSRSADPSRRTVFDLTELVLQTLLSFEDRATQKELDVDPQLPETHMMVCADKDAITQVIYNLLDNAVKFAAPKSCIVLRLYKDGGKAYVSVQDTGETIPPEDLPFIFDRFHKSDRSRSLDKDGVGLGLYLVKSIINNHDEDIAVKSENGTTEFVFTLPLAE